MNDEAAEYRHATSDIWEAASLWALGWPISHTDSEGDTVVFCFPAAGEAIETAAQNHQRGVLQVSSLALRNGYYAARNAMARELRGHERR